jgi:hypothetical protein
MLCSLLAWAGNAGALSIPLLARPRRRVPFDCAFPLNPPESDLGLRFAALKCGFSGSLQCTIRAAMMRRFAHKKVHSPMRKLT